MAPRISIVVPCHNEEANLAALLERLDLVLSAVASNAFEVILIDDGSKDRTVSAAIDLTRRYTYLSLIELSRNFGKEAALLAGMDHATGDCVIIMDADLQHPPEAIPQMLSVWEEGADVVACRRLDRNTDGALRAFLSRSFYALLSRGSSVEIPRNVGDFRLMDRRVIMALRELRETQRFTKGIYAWAGFRTRIIDFQVAERHAGVSSFNLRKLWHFAWDGITSFSTVPLRFFSYLGVVAALMSFAYGIYIVGHAVLAGREVPGYPSIMVALTFLGGVQLMGIGILGEYIGRMFIETKKRPVYLVRERYPDQGAGR
ncbi:MAG: glycosyltransferase family 2 protein [Devosia sp.]|uniref:glycosyltransferase family 2 protein n=1 Tax=Devosia sp. TaxID=1871048 RepID=UPI0019EFC507|nr:glycosyltransferase family 2 protein [Devosia sp.]MBF0680370.1 glycosyltransferase family 2 protein [Devosia sp.]